MKRSASTSSMRLLAPALTSAFLALTGISQSHAQTVRAWDRGAGTDVLTDANNWNPDGGVASGDTLQWDGSIANNLSLTFGGTVGGGGSSTGLNLHLLAAQTSNLAITGATIAAILRTGEISVSSGAGALTISTGRVLMQRANVSFTNNSTNTATFSSDTTIENTSTGSPRNLVFTGSGNWQVSGLIITGSNAQIALVKQGSGTITLNGANTYVGSTLIEAGTLAGVGSIASATTVTGGSIAAGTAGTVGILTFNNGLNLAGLTGLLKFDLATVGASDKIVLGGGALSGLLNFDDFDFNTLSGFGLGTYTLLESSTSIIGTLGGNLTGTIGGLNAALSLSGDNRHLLLTVSAIPEPSTYAAFAGAFTMAFAVQRNRRRKAA